MTNPHAVPFQFNHVVAAITSHPCMAAMIDLDIKRYFDPSESVILDLVGISTWKPRRTVINAGLRGLHLPR